MESIRWPGDGLLLPSLPNGAHAWANGVQALHVVHCPWYQVTCKKRRNTRVSVIHPQSSFSTLSAKSNLSLLREMLFVYKYSFYFTKLKIAPKMPLLAVCSKRNPAFFQTKIYELENRKWNPSQTPCIQNNSLPVIFPSCFNGFLLFPTMQKKFLACLQKTVCIFVKSLLPELGAQLTHGKASITNTNTFFSNLHNHYFMLIDYSHFFQLDSEVQALRAN